MGWRKLGMIFDLSQHNIKWIKSHAMLPTPLLLEDRIRIYFSSRNHEGQSCVTFVDINRKDPSKILYVHDLPILEKGKLGTFDDCGTLATCAVRNNDTVYLYYNGYNVRNTVPWSNAIGLAVSNDGGVSFKRMFEGAVVDRTNKEPYFAVSPCIMIENGVWHMWYTSGIGWITVKDIPEPLYVIKYGYSYDGIIWHRDNITCIPQLNKHEANARPSVIKANGKYKMWLTYRGSQDFRDGIDSYRIGYAEAEDPIRWNRDDSKAGISLSSEGWDSKMQAYPAVIEVDDKKYMFYNGNGFGYAGFGCAVWEE
jgi:hypothetical protein